MLQQASDRTLGNRMEACLGEARLRILIVGGGIAGMTLAALLRRGGEHPVVVERHADPAAGGYMLGLMPLGGRVLNGLGLHDAYLRESCPVSRYDFHDRRGKRLKSYSLQRIIKAFGAYRGIERSRLLRIIESGVDPDTVFAPHHVDALGEDRDGVTATFDDGSTCRFDVVVGADGMHSETRRMVFGDGGATPFSTGWAGWVTWVDPVGDSDTYSELWGDGWGVGLYPVRDRLGIFLAGRAADLRRTDPARYAESVIARLPEGRFRQALARIDVADRPFLWEMDDCRAKAWRSGRVVLLGDAAAGFLPTAGVGASMAMDSAAALADELRRAETGHMEYALSLYEARQRRRVETAQKNSRDLARFMFVNSRAGCWLRDRALRFYSLDRLIAGIEAVMTGK